MLKRAMGLMALVVIAGCSPKPYEGGWTYERTEDKLRQLSITTANTNSLEDTHFQSSVSLQIRKGSHDDDGVSFFSIGLNCNGNARVAIRVDNDPIEYLTCYDPTYFSIKLALDDPLAKRIMASKEVVIESGGQWSFNTAGLKL